MSKIDSNIPFFPSDSPEPESSKKTDSPLDIISFIEQQSENVMERFQKVNELYDNFLQETGLADIAADLKEGEFPDFQKLLLQARLGGAEEAKIQAQSAGQTSQALTENRAKTPGKKVAGDKIEDRVIEGITRGELGSDADVTEKELKNITGVVNFNKGKTLWEFDERLIRPVQVQESSEGKWGEGTVEGVVDFLSLHLRLFGDFTASIKDLVLKLGLGAQGAFELLGGHIKIKHDAPDVKLAGHDASLHNLLNLDAYIGAVAEGGALLTLGLADSDKEGIEGALSSVTAALRIGGEAFVGAAASVSGALSLGNLIGVNATASARAGAGAKAMLDIGYEDGKFDVDAGIGAALLYGGAFDWGFSVNVAEVASLAQDIGEEFLESPVEYPAEFLHDIGSVLGTNVGTILHFMDDVFGLSRKSDNIPSDYSDRQPRPVETPADNKPKPQEPLA